MVLRNGKLETATGQPSSPEADGFRRWFTEHYGDIAREARSVPPGPTAAAEPAAFFEELRRVAFDLRDRRGPAQIRRPHARMDAGV